MMYNDVEMASEENSQPESDEEMKQVSDNQESDDDIRVGMGRATHSPASRDEMVPNDASDLMEDEEVDFANLESVA